MCWAGQGGSSAAPSPHTPLPRSATKILTHADHFGMIRTAQRRFAPTVIGITRNSDRHQIGMRDRHRRNTQLLTFLLPLMPDEAVQRLSELHTPPERGILPKLEEALNYNGIPTTSVV